MSIDDQIPGQQELFAAPAPRPRRQASLRVPPGALTRFRSSHRTLCDRCVADIHARGVAAAPAPAVARWKLVRPDLPAELLCQRHRDEEQEARR